MTKIPWATHTINPWVGCTKVGEGCLNCYAERNAVRLGGMMPAGSQSRSAYRLATNRQKAWSGRIGYKLAEAKRQLDSIRDTASVFWCSMGDFFHPAVSDTERDTVLGWMLERFDLVHLILTERAITMLHYFDDADRCRRMHVVRNVWCGVSVENQFRADERLPWLKITNVPHRFISAEPLLGPIGLGSVLHRDHVQYVVVGAESRAGRPGRACKLQWVRDIVDQCLRAHVPLMVKQVHIDGQLVKIDKPGGLERIAAALEVDPKVICQRFV